MTTRADEDDGADGADGADEASSDGADHLTTSIVMSTMARVAESRGQLREALGIADEAVRLADASPGRLGHRFPVCVTRGRLLIELDRLAEAITERTALVSIMAVNNEIGVIQPLADLAALAHAKGAWFHSDAAQAAGKIPLDVEAMGIDLMSLSAHKLYGPKGIGALYVRRRPRVRLTPLFHGGGQERGLRSGTLPTPLCVGFGAAAAIASTEMAAEAARLAGLGRRLLAGLRAALPDTTLQGSAERRIPGNLNVAFPGVDA